MITAKDRAKLKGMAQKLEPVVLIGKGGITDSVAESFGYVLDKRELIKAKVLQNSGLEAKDACQQICTKLEAEFVQSIGNVFVVYKKSKRKDIKHIL